VTTRPLQRWPGWYTARGSCGAVSSTLPASVSTRRDLQRAEFRVGSEAAFTLAVMVVGRGARRFFSVVLGASGLHVTGFSSIAFHPGGSALIAAEYGIS
jgi:hypothetical protein